MITSLKRIVIYLLIPLFSIISKLIKVRIILNVFNRVFEGSPHFLVKLFVRFIELPNQNFIWNVKLLNNKIVKTPVSCNDRLTKEFALSYKWHSRGLKHIESFINDFYNKEIYWVDVGANMGLRSLYALSINRPVIFIEPNSKLIKYIEVRCELNCFKNYTILNYGASDFSGESLFFIDETSYNSTLEKSVSNNISLLRQVKIKVDTLDNLLSESLNNQTTFCMKIDVEGHEKNVIKGSIQLIKNFSPTMIIEINEKGDHLNEMINLLNDFNYQVYEVGYFKKNTFLKRVSLSNSDQIRFNDFLFVRDTELISKLKFHHIIMEK